MLGHQDEIASSYRRSCTDLKEKLKIGLDKIYNSCKDGCQGSFSSIPENSMDIILDPLIMFERKLLQYIRIKQEFQTENKNLQMKLKELQLNLQAKNVCISKLKEDIVCHYIQLEFLRKHNVKLEGDLGKTRKKLNQFERSEECLKKHLFSLHTDTKYKQALVCDGVYKKQNKDENTYYREDIKEIVNYKSSDDKETDDRYENIDGLRKLHVKLIEVCHENIFLKQALEKMKNVTDREDKLKRLLKSNNDNSTVLKIEDVQKELRNKFDISKKNERDQIEHIAQLNNIIESMRNTVLHLQFEKRNVELSVYKLKEYFSKMKDVQRKMKLMLSDKYKSLTPPVLKQSSEYVENFPIKDERDIQELLAIIRNLKWEKLQMEIEHHDELRSFTGKFGEMQCILRDIKTVCDDISEENELCKRNSKTSHKINKKKLFKEDNKPKNNFQTIEIDSKNEPDHKVIPEENCEEYNEISPAVMTTRCLNSYDSYENCTTKYTFVPLDIHRRVKVIEEQYERIASVCSKNMELLKEVNDTSLVSQVRELKVLALAKDKKLMEKQNRFEKYKRLLLNSVKNYRKSYNIKEKQYETLRNSYVPITLELKRLKIYISENENSMLKSEDNVDFTKVIQRIDNLTEKIKMHIESSKLSSYCDTSEIPNNSCELIVIPSEDDKNEEQLENRAIVNIPSTEKRKTPPISVLPEHLNKSEDTLNKVDQTVIILREKLNVSSSLIEQLKKDKTILQAALTQRDHLLGKIFNSFKQKIEGVAEEINEKYFLQRLCNDLKSTIKIYGCQNKILKEALENNNICTRTIYIQRYLKRNSANNTEDYIRGLLKQHRDSCQIQETFSDIHSRLELMRKDLSFLQNVAIAR